MIRSKNTKIELSNLSIDILHAEIVFGILGKNCRGNGICKIIQTLSHVSGYCETTYTEIEKVDESHLIFYFYIGNVPPSILEKYFSGEYMKLEKDFVLPSFIVQQLKLEKRNIPLGDYPISSSNKGWAILFSLV